MEPWLHLPFFPRRSLQGQGALQYWTTAMKVIFDTDPGIDDAMALLYLSKLPEIELLGITTVVGNADIATTTRKALFLRQRFGIAAPVIQGAGETLDG